MKQVTILLRPCGTCQRDPGFGTLHVGCKKCYREYDEREKQPRLVVTTSSPMTYAEPGLSLNTPDPVRL